MSKKKKKNIIYKKKEKNKKVTIGKKKPIINIKENILLKEKLNQIKRDLSYSIGKSASNLNNFNINYDLDAKIKHKKKRSGD